MALSVRKSYTLYHSTIKPISGKINIKGTNGYGFYLTSRLKYSKTFGDFTYKFKVIPVKSLVLYDNDVKKHSFFNISKEHFDNYINEGYDSLIWYRKNILTEFVVLNVDIIKNYYTL